MVKNLPANAGDTGDAGLILGLGRSPLEEKMAAHSSILAWRIPWTEKPGGLQSMGSQSAGHDRPHPHTVVITHNESSRCQLVPELIRPGHWVNDSVRFQ